MLFIHSIYNILFICICPINSFNYPQIFYAIIFIVLPLLSAMKKYFSRFLDLTFLSEVITSFWSLSFIILYCFVFHSFSPKKFIFRLISSRFSNLWGQPEWTFRHFCRPKPPSRNKINRLRYYYQGGLRGKHSPHPVKVHRGLFLSATSQNIVSNCRCMIGNTLPLCFDLFTRVCCHNYTCLLS